MATTPPNAYFETDQIKHAVALWKLSRRASEPDFDVLKFGRDWQYAETVLVQCLASEHESVSDAALELMQLRMQFEQKNPERALKLGARPSGSPAPQPGAGTPVPRQAVPAAPGKPTSGTSTSASKDGSAPPTKYLKSLR